MAPFKKRKRSFKPRRSVKRRRLSFKPRRSSKFSRPIKRRPLFRKRRFSTSRKRTGLAHQLSSLRKTVNKLMPGNALMQDQLNVRTENPVNCRLVTGYGLHTTQQLATPFSFTSSPLDPWTLVNEALPVLLAQFPSASKISELVTRKINVKSWWTSYRITNPTNDQVRVKCITLRCKEDVSSLTAFSEAGASITKSITDRVIDPGANLEPYWGSFEQWWSWTYSAQRQNQVLSGYPPNTLSTLNPPGPNPVGTANFLPLLSRDLPLTDNLTFRRHFKITKTITKVLNPGRTAEFIKKSKRMRTIHISDYFDEPTSDVKTTYSGGLEQFLGLKLFAKKGHSYFIFVIEPLQLSYRGGSSDPEDIQDTNVIMFLRQNTFWKFQPIPQAGYTINVSAPVPNNLSDTVLPVYGSTGFPQAWAL